MKGIIGKRWRLYIFYTINICFFNSICEGKRQIYFDMASNDNFSEIDLSSFSGHSVNVQILISTTIPEQMDKFFRVFSPKGYGLMGFVRTAHLRVTWKTEMLDGFQSYISLCRDYISYEDGQGTIEKICHEVNGHEKQLYPRRLVGPRVLRSHEGQILLQIHTDYNFTLPNNNQSKILAEIIFTSYTDCWRSKNSEIVSDRDFTRCSKENSFSCIKSSLICDGDVNCLFEDSFGQDEKNCRRGGLSIGINDDISSTEISSANRNLKNGNSPMDPTESEYQQIRQYFIPTGFIFFIIWGVITLLRKCYKCYKTEYGKDELYY